MIEAAHRNKRFLMEAYWSRYFPVWKHIQERGIEEIEGARVVLCDFGINVEVRYWGRRAADNIVLNRESRTLP